ncbi:MAG TPA: hypothetical protein VEK57_30915 [Thermoanaerobaculia bacterium]|nr:hypothetical protein [Thermoanaerobaculia bacterium]
MANKNINATAPTGAAQVTGPVRRTSALNPQVAITIAVDTSYVASQGGGLITQGVYMFDNQLDNGSSGEGTLELSSMVNAGDLIGFNIVPVNTAGPSGDQVIITGFNVSQGNVFGSTGTPVEQPTPPAGEPVGAYWIGQAINSGNQTYQIHAEVSTGLLQPLTFFVNWDPFITCS